MSQWNTIVKFNPESAIPDLTVTGRKVEKVGELSALIADFVHPYLFHPSGGSVYGVGVGGEGFSVFRDDTILATGTITHQKVLNPGHGRRKA
jgi:hypothetical protein